MNDYTTLLKLPHSSQIVGLFLAFATRKVKIKGIDDAKEIAATIYVTSLVLAIMIVSMYTINELINTYAAVFSTGFFIGTTVIMAFVFISKVKDEKLVSYKYPFSF